MEQRVLTKGKKESFNAFLENKELIYVDKTAPICALAKERDAFLLTRPRRMGKTTMISTLEYLFSKGTQGTEGLFCNEFWPENQRYFVFRFSWHKLDISSAQNFIDAIVSSLNNYALYFDIKIPTDWKLADILEYFFNQCLNRLADKDFMSQHSELTVGATPFCPNEVVLLIDEYDAPLSKSLDDPALFNELREVYTQIFSTIKDLDFRFVFITGVSSYAQTSIFSGPNQFVNISLYSDYATCCGYTRAEIEHYFGDELDRAQEVLKLESREQLFEQLSYYYDGYIFSDEEASFAHDEDKKLRLFNPVSVSSFLNNPKRQFRAYWANTGALSSFFLNMMKLCNKTITQNLLHKLYPNSLNQDHELKAVFNEAITSFFPIFGLAINKDDENQFNALLIKVDVESLVVKLGDVKLLSQNNAIVVLFQSGYLSIKKVVGNTAYLGLANHEVAQVLAKVLQEQLEDQREDGEKPLSAADQHILHLLNHSEEVFNRLHQGGQTLCDLINDTFNCIDKRLFNKDNNEQVLTSILAFMLKATGYKTLREVKSMFGIADIVIYKPKTDPLVPDVVLEFKLARPNGNIVRMLEKGSKQVADRKYGVDFLNSNPHRYCIVLSQALKGVGAISRIHRDGTYTTEYKCPKIGANGKVPINRDDRSTSKQTSNKAKSSASSAAKQITRRTQSSAATKAKQTTSWSKKSSTS